MGNYALVIHGGAGSILKQNISPDRIRKCEEVLKESLLGGNMILKNGGSCVDAVSAAIKVLENSPLFNAGRGSVFTVDETIEMDAAIMDGNTLNAGAVTGLKRVKNPINAAKAVMSNSNHVFLAGQGAESFAIDQGLEIEEESYFIDEHRLHQFRRFQGSDGEILDHDADESGVQNPRPSSDIEFDHNIDDKYGTVGAVALDVYGNVAAGTSTGGMTNKKWGRIGDTPIIGAGTYANNETCAISCTGHGEYFIRLAAAHNISSLMKYKNWNIRRAADETIHEQLKALNGEGGVIGIDVKGNVAISFNTKGMYRGYITESGIPQIAIFADDVLALGELRI